MSVNLLPLQKIFKSTPGALPWEEVESCLMHLIEMAKDEGHIGLEPKSGIDFGTLKTALQAVTDFKVKKVVPVSVSAPHERPPWMSKDSYKKWRARNLSRWLDGNFHMCLYEVLKAKFGRMFEDEVFSAHSSVQMIFGNDDQGRHRGSLLYAIRQAMSPTVFDGYGSNAYIGAGCKIRRNLWHIAAYLISFAYQGDRENFEICAALMKTQKGAFGLGFKADEPTVFVTLCA